MENQAKNTTETQMTAPGERPTVPVDAGPPEAGPETAEIRRDTKPTYRKIVDFLSDIEVVLLRIALLMLVIYELVSFMVYKSGGTPA